MTEEEHLYKFDDDIEFTNDNPITDENFDYKDYENSFSNRAKQAWICIQVTMMTVYMIIGIRNYNKVIKGWSKVKSLFVLQTFVILYLAINEFTHRHIHGIFLIYLFTQYSLFLTFCLMIDSCVTEEQEQNWTQSKGLIFNRVYRVFMHTVTFTLFIMSFFMKDCDERIYPFNFLTVTCIILTHQIYDFYLKNHDYLINFDDLPPTSPNKLRYNKELFRKQTGCLFYANLIFGLVSMVTVAAGFFILNKQH